MIADIFVSFLTVSLTASIMITLMLILSSYRRNKLFARFSCLIWLLLAVRMLIPLHYSIPQAPFQITLPQTQITALSNLSSVGQKLTQTNKPGISAAAYPLNTAANSANQANNPADAAADISPMKGFIDEVSGLTFLQVLTILWLIGVIIFLSHKLISFRIFNQLVKRWSRPVTDRRIVEKVQELSESLDITVRISILISEKVTSPLMMGLVRPRLILPDEYYSDTELFYILHHELVHLKRRDIWFKLLLILANAVHWYNPMVYLMNKETSRDIELACDDIVIRAASSEQRKEYSEALLSSIHKQQSRAALLTTYFYGGSKQMKERFRNINNTKKRKKGIMALLILLFLAVASTFISCQLYKKSDFQVSAACKTLTQDEFIDINTSGFNQPVITNFKKLTFKLDLYHAEDRKVTFPDMAAVKKLFSENDYCFGNYSTQDNKVEDFAHYNIEMVLYTGDLTETEIRDRLKSLKIGASYTDEQGRKVEKMYLASDIAIIDGSSSSDSGTPSPIATSEPKSNTAASFDEAKSGVIDQIDSYASNDMKNVTINITNGWKSDKILGEDFDYYIVLAGSSKDNSKQGAALVYQHMKSGELKLTQTYLTPGKYGAVKIKDFNAYNLTAAAGDGHQWIFNLWNGFSENE